MSDETPTPNPLIAVIRNIIDIPEAEELSDAVISEAIDEATVFVNGVANPASPLDMKNLAIKNLAALWSFQSYSDRVHHEAIGSFDENANWNPILSRAWERDTREKVAALERRFQMIIDRISGQVKTIPVFSSIR
jgi:hypothetical protein